jgi:hypothetical protein
VPGTWGPRYGVLTTRSTRPRTRRDLVVMLADLLRAERRQRGTRTGSRALTCWYQAIMVLVWFRKRDDIPLLGAGFELSRATSQRHGGPTACPDGAGRPLDRRRPPQRSGSGTRDNLGDAKATRRLSADSAPSPSQTSTGSACPGWRPRHPGPWNPAHGGSSRSTPGLRHHLLHRVEDPIRPVCGPCGAAGRST